MLRYKLCIVAWGGGGGGGGGYDTALCRDTAGPDVATRRSSARVRAMTRSGTGATQPGRRPRYDSAHTTTRRSARAAYAQPGPWVGALCTRLSFDSVHCFESLFGTLFMNTVHEHCS